MLIKPLKRGYTINNRLVFDVETQVRKNTNFKLFEVLDYKLAVVKHGKKIINCRTQKDMTSAIISSIRKDKLNLIFAHNLDFDLRFVDLDSILNKGYKIISQCARPCFLILRKQRTTLIFLDTLSWFKGSLAELGELFGLSKLKIDFNLCTYDELKTYCVRDCDITHLLVEFLDMIHVSYNIKWTLSLAQLSYRIFKRHFLKYSLLTSDSVDIMQLERDSYFGGRVEVFDFSEHTDIHVYDFNSLYPYIMKTTKVPVKITKYLGIEACKHHSFENLMCLINESLEQDKAIIVRVIVDIEDQHIPLIALRKDDKLIFPTGTFETVIVTPELIRCKHNIVQVKEIAIYEQDYLFADFVDTFYDLRRKAQHEHDYIMSYFYKILLNSLYGKFGQRKFSVDKFPDADNLIKWGNTEVYDEDSDTWHSVDFFNGYAHKRVIDDINPNSFVAIPSHITSSSRVYLYDFIKKHEKDIVYCDTDSLFLPYYVEEYAENEGLGELKLEYVYEIFQAYGAKDYEGLKDGEYFRKIKGIPRYATQISPNSFSYTRIAKQRETARRFKDSLVREIPVVKELSRNYTKRIVFSDKSTRAIKEQVLEEHRLE